MRTFTHYLYFNQQALRFFSALVLLIVFATGLNAQVNGSAVASFGLRKISTSYTGSAIEARRCDGKTADIGFTTCGDLDTAALKTFAMAGAPLSMITATTSAAYSLRKLVCGYTGSAIRVRRSSDNTQQDIGFINSADLDTVSLKTFVGAGSGFVVTWYDQSGNGRNATQATAANQPRIVNTGVVHRQNGMPSINFRGASDYLSSTLTGVQASSGGTITTANFVAQSNAGIAGTILSNGDAGTDRYSIHMPWSDGVTYFDIGDITAGGRITGIAPWTILNTGTFIRNGANAIIYRNAMPVTFTVPMSTAVTSTAALTIGGSPAFGSYMVGFISEICIFPSALSTAEREYFEWNQSKYYSLIGGFNSAALPTTALPGATVETWYDQTGNGRNMGEATASEQPVILSAGIVTRMNGGLPAMVGSTANQVNLTGAIGGTYSGTRLTAMSVLQADEMVAANRRVMSFSNGTNSDWQNAGSFNVNQRGTGGTNLVVERAGTAINPTTTIAQNSPLTFSVLFDGTNRVMYNNGTATATLADNQAFVYNNFRVLHSINPGFEASEGFNGRMSEFTIFHPVANNPRLSRRNLMESSQAAYYGIAIAAAADKYAAAPSTHNLYVNGIGREGSATDTVLSTRSTVGMGLSATTAQFLQTNGDYMMIGTSCTAAPASISTSDLPAGTQQRWARDWFLDKTDLATTGGTVTIYFDFGDYGISTNPAGAATNYVLLFRAGASGAYGTATISVSRTITGDRVVFATNASNISDGYYTLGTTNSTNSPLPVELTTFEGNTCSNSVCLHWETATELNNAYFMVGRSADALEFESIGKVDSKAVDGNSNQLLNYTFKDLSPLSGLSYYQLSQYDIDGESKKSRIISVNFDAARNISFVVYPNPNQGEFSVDFSGLENNHELTVFMVNLQGKTVYRNIIDMQTLSNNTFKIIPDTKIPSGTYLVVFEVEGIKYTSKVIVE